MEARPLTVADWRGFLREHSAEFLNSNELRELEAAVVAAEQRLGVRLPELPVGLQRF